MPRRLFGIGLSLILSSGIALAANDSDIRGSWAREDGSVKMSIAPCGPDLCATNTWVTPGDTAEAVGDKLVMTLHAKSAAAFEGEAFDERRHETYSMDLTLGQGTLKTHGCLLDGLVCKTTDWTRIQ